MAENEEVKKPSGTGKKKTGAGDKVKARGQEQEQSISFTNAQLQQLIQSTTIEAVKAAMGSLPKQEAPKKEDGDRVSRDLTNRDNARGRRGSDQFIKLAEDKESFVIVKIDSIYREYTSSSLTVTLNGSTVKVPVDGKPYEVHERFRDIIEEKLHFISERKAQNQRHNDMLGEGDFEQVR